MICEKIIGNLAEDRFAGCRVDYVEIEWHEAFKKLHKKITTGDKAVGIRLDNEILTRGFREGDVLYADGREVIAVHIPACDSIVIRISEGHMRQALKVCYEIGNKHAALFYGDTDDTFITPYNAPAFEMLQKMHGVSISREMMALDFDKSIASAIHNHTH